MVRKRQFKRGYRVVENNLETFNAFVWAWMGLGVVVFASLFFISAPYGRHQREGWGPTIPSRLGWIIMEAPSAIIMAALFVASEHDLGPAAWTFLILWQVHYIHRSFIYPFRCQTAGKTMPAAIAGMAILFNGVNAGTNGMYLFHTSVYADAEWLVDPRFIIGCTLFFTGMVINISSDNILLRLRAARSTQEGYSVPKGGLFRWVSSPNYLGEIIEWTGFAIATWSVSGVAFAVWTAANLVPRAVSNHAWYKATFPDYPSERRAILPGLY